MHIVSQYGAWLKATEPVIGTAHGFMWLGEGIYYFLLLANTSPQLRFDNLYCRNNGQSLAIQDCLYRYMASSRYVVFSDVDEFLIPRGQNIINWSQLARSLHHPKSCAFQFPSVIFAPLPPVQDVLPRPLIEPSTADLLTMRSNERSADISQVRTKCMVRPYEIFEAGIHHISKPILANLSVDRVRSSRALMHHYRPCGLFLDEKDCVATLKDLTIRRYVDELERAADIAWNELSEVL